MHGAIPPLPNTSSWHSKHRDNFTFYEEVWKYTDRVIKQYKINCTNLFLLVWYDDKKKSSVWHTVFLASILLVIIWYLPVYDWVFFKLLGHFIFENSWRSFSVLVSVAWDLSTTTKFEENQLNQSGARGVLTLIMFGQDTNYGPQHPVLCVLLSHER
jgi:hypothetical protein